MRVAGLDMRRTSSKCPPGLCLNTTGTDPRTCRIYSFEGNCSSDIYHVGINYFRVCGKVQVGTLDTYSITLTSRLDGITAM